MQKKIIIKKKKLRRANSLSKIMDRLIFQLFQHLKRYYFQVFAQNKLN